MPATVYEIKVVFAVIIICDYACKSEEHYGYCNKNGSGYSYLFGKGGLGKLYTGKAAIKHPAAKYYESCGCAYNQRVDIYAKSLYQPLLLQDGL